MERHGRYSHKGIVWFEVMVNTDCLLCEARMACSRDAVVVYSLHGRGSEEVTAWYCEEPRYVVFVFQIIPLNRSQGQVHPCSQERHGYALHRVTFVC